MKNIKRFLAVVCALGLLLSLTVHAMATDAYQTGIFTADDMQVNGLWVYSSKDEASVIFGMPDSSQIQTYETADSSYEVWQYGDLTLTFNDMDQLIRVDAYGMQYTGPRGVQVGQTWQEALAGFYVDDEYTTGDVFYSGGYIETIDALLPPCGYIQHYDDYNFSANYVDSTQPMGDDIFNNPEDYVYLDLAHLQINFGEDSTVVSFNWSLGPWAE